MKYCVSIANYGVSSDPKDYVTLAKAVEDAGWDGFFLWDHINLGKRGYVCDPWVVLSAIASQTNRILIGTWVTPLPRRRPQKVACEAATLDALSDGRVVLGVGSGWLAKKEFEVFGEESDIRIRAEKLDESLEIIKGLWSGEPFSFRGKHYSVGEVTFRSTPVQRPRIPIWVGGNWPKKKPFRRAARYEGVVPLGVRNPALFAEMKQYIEKHRKTKGEFAYVCSSPVLPRGRREEVVRQFEQVGANWHLESWGTQPYRRQLKRVDRGPPT